MSEDELISAVIASKLVKRCEKNFDDTKLKMNFSKPRIEWIRKKINELKYKFSK